VRVQFVSPRAIFPPPPRFFPSVDSAGPAYFFDKLFAIGLSFFALSTLSFFCCFFSFCAPHPSVFLGTFSLRAFFFLTPFGACSSLASDSSPIVFEYIFSRMCRRARHVSIAVCQFFLPCCFPRRLCASTSVFNYAFAVGVPLFFFLWLVTADLFRAAPPRFFPLRRPTTHRLPACPGPVHFAEKPFVFFLCALTDDTPLCDFSVVIPRGWREPLPFLPCFWNFYHASTWFPLKLWAFFSRSFTFFSYPRGRWPFPSSL